MGNTELRNCCFASCTRKSDLPDLAIELWPPSDLPAIQTRAHYECLHCARFPGVVALPPDPGVPIPAKASCMFCGKRLPIIGRHPYALVVHQAGERGRYWAHEVCLREHVVIDPGVW